MRNKKVAKWLQNHGITLQSSFSAELKRLCKIYQKTHNVSNIEKVYELLGVKKQYLYYWENKQISHRIKKITNTMY